MEDVLIYALPPWASYKGDDITEKEIKDMAKINGRPRYGKEDRLINVGIKLMGTGITRDQIKQVLEADAEYLQEVLFAGGNIKIEGLCLGTLVPVSAKPERKGINPSNGESIMLPPSKEHTKILFKAVKPLAEKMKEETWGNPF